MFTLIKCLSVATLGYLAGCFLIGWMFAAAGIPSSASNFVHFFRKRYWRAYYVAVSVQILVQNWGNPAYKRDDWTSGTYGGILASDEFYGIRWKRRGRDLYGLVGLSIDHTWYQPMISYGVVWCGRWHGIFLHYPECSCLTCMKPQPDGICPAQTGKSE